MGGGGREAGEPLRGEALGVAKSTSWPRSERVKWISQAV